MTDDPKPIFFSELSNASLSPLEAELVHGRQGGVVPRGILTRPTAVERTKAAMADMTEGRKNQARVFFNRVEKRKRARKLEKKNKKRMRSSR